MNLGLVLRHLRDAGPRSRARIAQETGLNKATVSSLVAELVRRGLVSTGEVDREGTVGRPGVRVELDGHGVCGIGVELNVDYAAVLAMDLRGQVLLEQRVALDVPALGPERTLDCVADVVTAAIGRVSAGGATPVGMTVAVPGLVRSAEGTVTLAPNLHWREVPVVAELGERLGRPAFPIHAENDANLSALAEYAMGSEARTPDLVYLTGEVGVGGGVMVAGQLLRGASGLSGEVGHMPLGSPDRVCGCGRRGCWETVVGLAALLHDAADEDDPVRDPARDLETRLAEIERRAAAGDERTLTALTRIGTQLGIGASILINVFNPQVLVLGGYFAVVGRYLMEPLIAELRPRVLGPELAGARVVLSTLGFTAAVRGGAHVALSSVFADPTLVPAAAPAPDTSPLQEGVAP
ncbi:MAG TPA: ROK family transcriptional regulator [Geodermatophilus sp.]|nr:ROK family transcriptional regulator [Geodermatophilus sp.]